MYTHGMKEVDRKMEEFLNKSSSFLRVYYLLLHIPRNRQNPLSWWTVEACHESTRITESRTEDCRSESKREIASGTPTKNNVVLLFY